MKNKKLTYFLLALVVSLWGYLIYKVFGAIGSNNDDAPQIVVSQQKIEDLAYYRIKKQDSLLLNYRDPLYRPHNTAPTTTELEQPITSGTSVPLNKYTPPPVLPPETLIVYTGYIENEEKKKRVAIVKIDNKQYMIATGESQNGVTIQEVQQNFIRVQHKGNSKTIYK